jgi:hypothetical protein
VFEVVSKNKKKFLKFSKIEKKEKKVYNGNQG